MHSIHHALQLSQLHRLDLNLYPLFIAIFEQHSISKAAHLLCMSQSAASHALQRLRQQLDDELFVRRGQRMYPTAFAQQIYPHIQQALSHLQSIQLPQQQFSAEQLQHVHIAIHDELEPLIVPKLVAHFHQLNVKLHWISGQLQRKTMLDDLIRQQVDVVIDLQQSTHSQLLFQPLLSDHFVVCSQLHSMSKQDYLHAPLIGVSSRRSGVLLEDFYLKQRDLHRSVFLRCQHYSTAMTILAQYPEAVLTIPYNIMQQFQLPAQIHCYPAPLEFPALHIGLYRFQGFSQDLRLNFICQQIHACFATHTD